MCVEFARAALSEGHELGWVVCPTCGALALDQAPYILPCGTCGNHMYMGGDAVVSNPLSAWGEHLVHGRIYLTRHKPAIIAMDTMMLHPYPDCGINILPTATTR